MCNITQYKVPISVSVTLLKLLSSSDIAQKAEIKPHLLRLVSAYFRCIVSMIEIIG